MSLQDIAILRDKTPPELEIEAFVHGAMCMSVSGRCLLSNYMAGRDANRGQCAQPCRWKYYLSEETRPGQLYEIGENENGSYILNANDLCTAPFIDLICKAGVDSLKIEGRAKTFYYVASVTAAYRKALDAYLADPANDNFELPAEVYEELTRTSHRHYSPGSTCRAAGSGPHRSPSGPPCPRTPIRGCRWRCRWPAWPARGQSRSPASSGGGWCG